MCYHNPPASQILEISLLVLNLTTFSSYFEIVLSLTSPKDKNLCVFSRYYIHFDFDFQCFIYVTFIYVFGLLPSPWLVYWTLKTQQLK